MSLKVDFGLEVWTCWIGPEFRVWSSELGVTQSHSTTPQVTFQTPAKLWIQHAALYGPLAQLSSAPIPPCYHSCLFIHIPIPDSIPPHISCSPFPIPIPNPQPPIPKSNSLPWTLLHPKSPSELRLSFGSSMQSSTVFWPSLVWPIFPTLSFLLICSHPHP